MGLVTYNGISVPLKAVSVDVHIFCNIAEVTSTLTYINEENEPVEAQFTFPVDDGSCVFQFEADIEGRHITAEIQDKEKAKVTYKDALDSGKTAMLLKEDESAGDIFSCSLGNLPPKTEATLTMKYVIELFQEPDGKFRFTLPTVLNPRYYPAPASAVRKFWRSFKNVLAYWFHIPDAKSYVAAEGANYLPPCLIPYDFKLVAVVEGYYKIVSVTSGKDNLRTQLESDNKVAKITLAEEFKFDHDLQFLLQYEEPFKPQIVLEEGNTEADGMMKEHVILMNFYAKLDEVTMATAGEYVFVIDRSCSMAGQRIQDAKEALLLFVKSLPPDCYFNIVSFGAYFELLFPSGSEKYTKETLNTAQRLIQGMDANMDWTKLLDPLKAVFETNAIPGYNRSVFVLTDGEVSNIYEVFSLVREQSNKTSTRVFSLGIGEGASTALVKGIARNGKGKAAFIAEGQRIQTKVVALLKCAMQPAVTDISLSWNLPQNVTPICIPTELPSVLTAGERLSLFAVLQGVSKHTNYAPSTVTMNAQHDNKPVEHTMSFTLCEAGEIRPSAPVHRLATKAQIKLLQDRIGDYYASYLKTNVVEDVQSLQQKIIDLSRYGNVVSKYTAFVAIDAEGQNVVGSPLLTKCPVPSLSTGVTRSRICLPKKVRHPNKKPGQLNQQRSYPKTKKQINETETRYRRKKNCQRSTQCRSRSSGAVMMKFLGDAHIYEERCSWSEEEETEDEVSDEFYKDSRSYEYVTELDHAVYSRKEEKDLSTEENDMMAVVLLQQISGNWNYSTKLLRLMNVKKNEFDKLDMSNGKDVVITLVALCWLRKQFSHRYQEWQLIEAKAKAWLSSKHLTSDVEDLIKKTAGKTIFTKRNVESGAKCSVQ